MNFVVANKKRINPAQNKMRKYDWKCFQISERRGSWKNWWLLLVINPSRQILSFTSKYFENLGAPRGTILKNRINHLITPSQAIGHKIPDLQTLSNSSKIRQQKNDEFLKKLTIGNLVCITTCYSFKPAKPFQWAKQKSQDRDTLKSPWLMPWGTLTKIAHFS